MSLNNRCVDVFNFYFLLKIVFTPNLLALNCVPVSEQTGQWAYLMLKFKQISMENVNTHIRMRDFPLDLLELMSLICSECEHWTYVCLSLSLFRAACVCVRTEELNAQSSE